MKELIDKLTYEAKKRKKEIIFLLIILLSGIISGSLYTTILTNSDKDEIIKYINNFINQINNNNLNIFIDTIKSNTIFILIIWILGISAIGIPINIYLFFIKNFIIGFSLSSFILKYKIKGILLGLIYIFPHYIINIFIYALLLIFSIDFSKKIIKSLNSKKGINFNKTFKRYIVILILSIVIIILTAALEAYLMPYLIKKIIIIIK